MPGERQRVGRTRPQQSEAHTMGVGSTPVVVKIHCSQLEKDSLLSGVPVPHLRCAGAPPSVPAEFFWPQVRARRNLRKRNVLQADRARLPR